LVERRFSSRAPGQILSGVLCALLVLGGSLAASAAGARIFVSGFGDNTNPGTLSQPVRGLVKAMALVDPGGEIVVLDSAVFAPVTVNKPVTVVATPGAHASIAAPSGNGITVSVGAFDTVVLRGLTITGSAGPGSGIRFAAGGALHVENCVISGFTNNSGGNGISVAAGLTNGFLQVTESVCRDNFYGFRSQSGKAALDHVRLVKNVHTGLFISGSTTRVTITDSVASDNSSGQGMFANLGSQLNVERCQAANNGNGIEAYDGAIVRVSNSTVTNNAAFGLYYSAATLETRANNTVRGNGTGDVLGGATVISGQ
jgi:hypothetical protein